MEFDFAKKLKELRAGREVTQETLAKHLQISPQAVSKWERGEGYPDITLLPRIAAFFDVTVDELLGTTEEIRREKISKWKDQSHKLRKAGEIEKDRDLWESAYSEYPKELEVISAYMYSLWQVFFSSPAKDEKTVEQGEKVIKLGEEILARSSDPGQRYTAIQLTVFTYDKLGNAVKAKEYADMAPSICRNVLYTHINDEDNLKCCQILVVNLLDLLTTTIEEKIEQHYSTETRIEIAKNVLSIYQGLFKNGDYGFYNCRMSIYTGKLSRLYAIAGDKEKCFAELRDSFEYAKAYDEYNASGKPYAHSSPLVDKVVADPGTVIKSYTGNDCSLVLGWIKNSVYDPYRDDPEFIRIKTALEEHAK